jgi:diguanylate cyclase (GGDEF)-like protein
MEFAAALLLALLFVYYLESRHAGRMRDRWFGACVLLSLGTILADAASIFALRRADLTPAWVCMALCSIYYLLVCFGIVLISLYLTYLVFEHAPGRRGMRSPLVVNGILMGILLVLVLVNPATGWLFGTPDDLYTGRTLDLTACLLVAVNLVVLLVCYRANRATASLAMRKTLRLLPGAIAAAVVLRLVLRSVPTSGILLAFADTILFLSFQNSRIGVDALTGLGNRSMFMDELSAWLTHHRQCHVILLSVSNFRQVNLKFGADVGDEFLYAVARYLCDRPQSARTYRVGDTDFAILCPAENCPHSGTCIREMQARFRQPWTAGGEQYTLAACFADLLWTGEDWNATQIMERLEYSMHLAKAQGSGARSHFDPTQDAAMARRSFLINQLQEAVEKDTFQIYYQPVYNTSTRQFTTAEALIRLTATTGERLGPAEFIPIAEETGMIREISWLVLEKVCRFLSENPDLPIGCISINWSTQQFQEPDMEQHLAELLHRYRVDPQRIKIEITERVLAEDVNHISASMQRLCDRGVGFYLDDFGIGYSNISRVLSLPFETVKFDKVLTDRLLGTEKDSDFITALVMIFRRASYNVVAEGAETLETVNKLDDIGVERIQGFYFAKPLPEADFVRFLSDRRPAAT